MFLADKIFMKTKERALAIVEILKRVYPTAHCELDYTNAFELLIATILSAQCTDKRVNLVTPGLFKKYPTIKTLAKATQEEIEEEVKSTGFYRNKAKAIRNVCIEIESKYAGQVPQSMEELKELPGVGRKTANVVLGNAFGKNVGVVVDTHVSRLAQRIGLTQQTTPEKIEQELMKLVPQDLWTDFSHWLIWHGRRRCAARKPDCEGCEVKDLCLRLL